jgi:hypothetical protein
MAKTSSPSLAEYLAGLHCSLLQVGSLQQDAVHQFAKLRAGSPATSIVAGREITPDMSSSASFSLLSSWIQQCATEHENCMRVPETVLQQLPEAGTRPIRYTKKSMTVQDHAFLPFRVLDVGPPDGSHEPYLLETSEQPWKTGYYIALSHCWGKTSPLTTTLSTYRERLRRIPFAILPPTFRDAVKITRTLGIQYLWIDSLCILQDSEADWQYHSKMMGAVYALSFLTINASASPDSQGGCFAKEPLLSSPTCVLKPADSPGDIHFTKYIDETPLDGSQKDYTGARGWCLQETLLPKRVVIYGHRVLGWLCDTHTISQQSGQTTTAAGLRMEGALAKTFQLQRWAFIVTNYTRRKITYEKDKLVALSGIAGEIAYVLKDKYLAGIWRRNMIDGLLWKVSHGCNAVRPSQYRAPSWSWASLEGPVTMKSSISPEENVTARILDYHIGHVSDTSFGEVSEGTVRLTGPVCQLQLPKEFRLTNMPLRADCVGAETKNTITCEIDVCDIAEEKHLSTKEVLCLGMAVVSLSRGTSLWGEGLLIVSNDDNSSFFRIGHARIEDMFSFKKIAVETELTLR